MEIVAENFEFDGQFIILDACHSSVVGMAPAIASRQGRSLSEVITVVNESQMEQLCHNDVKSKQLTTNEKSLVAYPLQCNFSGTRYPKHWIPRLRNSGYFLLIDAASYLATAEINLGLYPADYVVLSFYKMFGFPTGLGALIIRRDLVTRINKTYFGGGTVNAIAVNPIYYSLKTNGEEFYNGTIPFQEIIAVGHGFDYLESRFQHWNGLSQYCCDLAQLARKSLEMLKHFNGNPVCKLYYPQRADLGPIIAFNILDHIGNLIGNSDVSRLAQAENIHLRTGRLCNPGASQKYLNLSSHDVKSNHEVYGHCCGDGTDFINGKATGAIRISFCYANTAADVNVFVDFIQRYFSPAFPSAISTSECHPTDLSVLNSFIYPIKSCQGFQVRDWPISNTGFLWDRKFRLVDHNSKTLTIKNCPKMVNIKIDNLDRTRGVLIVSWNSKCPIEIFLSKDATANDMETIDRWFSMHLERECHLSTCDHLDRTSFVNKAQFLLCSQASFDSLLKKIPINDSKHVEISSFRPNFIIENTEAFAELSWIGNDFRFLGQRFRVSELCQRCDMICIDKNGARNKEPLKTLSTMRVNGRIVFGVYLELIQTL